MKREPLITDAELREAALRITGEEPVSLAMIDKIVAVLALIRNHYESPMATPEEEEMRRRGLDLTIAKRQVIALERIAAALYTSDGDLSILDAIYELRAALKGQ